MFRSKKANAIRVLVLLILLSMIAWVPAAPKGVWASSEKTIAYPVDGGNLYFNTESGTIETADKEITKADIPAAIENIPVRTIGEGAFYGCSKLTDLVLPDSVERIENGALLNCSALEQIEVNESNSNYCAKNGILFSKDGTAILQYPKGKSDTSYEIPEGVTTIGESTFSGCSKLTEIVMPDGVVDIGHGAFLNCSGLTGVVLPDGVKRIGNLAFYGCSNMASITFSNSVVTIQEAVFHGCKALTEINIYETSGNSWGGYASAEGILFYKSFTQNSDTLDTLVCYPAGRPDTSYTIPDYVTRIEDAPFYGCSNLTSITLSDDIDIVSGALFENCKALETINANESSQYYCSRDGVLFSKDGTRIIRYPAGKPDTSYTIPEGTVSIGSLAFEECLNLAEVTIPDSVTNIEEMSLLGYALNIDEDAYQGIKGFTIKTPSAASAAASYAKECGFTLVVLNQQEPIEPSVRPTEPEKPSSGPTTPSEPASKPTEPSGDPTQPTPESPSTEPVEPSTSPTQPAPTEPIGPSTGKPVEKPSKPSQLKPGSTALDPKSNASYIITKIGKKAGNNTVTYKKPKNSKKTDVVVPSVVKIGGKTYQVTKIADNAFKGNRHVKSVKIGANVQTIGANAFNQCTKLKSVSISGKVKTIQKGAFANCKNLKSITIKTTSLTKKSVGKSAFKGISTKAVIKVPKGKVNTYKKILQTGGLSKKVKVK